MNREMVVSTCCRILLVVLGGVLALGAWAFEADVPLGGEGWRFAKDPSCTLKAEAPNFDDTGWETVRVPHDWAISGPFDPKGSGGTGKLPWRGVGWYRKTFELKDIGCKADANGRRVPTDCVFLDFDGAMAAPKVYVNGHYAGGWDYGYASFRVDATPFVKVGARNVVAVRCDTRDHRSRWYPGAGLYRRVTASTARGGSSAWATATPMNSSPSPKPIPIRCSTVKSRQSSATPVPANSNSPFPPQVSPPTRSY